jgi:tetratricopeptide (TPR) repeat protein
MSSNDPANVLNENGHPQQEARRLFVSGVALFKTGKYEQAKLEFAAALRLRPQYPQALRALALTLLKLQDRERATRYFNIAAALWARLGRFDDAKQYYAQCLKAGLPARNPFLDLSQTMLEAGETDRALCACEAALELTPGDEDLACLFARALQRDGQEKRAARFLASYLRQHPRSPKAMEVADDLPEPPRPARPTPSPQPKAPRKGAPEDAPVLELDPAAPEEPPSRHTMKQPLPHTTAGGTADAHAPQHDHREKRRFPRIPLADYLVRLAKRKEPHPVVDICRQGIGFKSLDQPFKQGQTLHFDLMILEKVKVKKLAAVVRHVSGELVGCELLDLSKKQRKQLDEILSTAHEEKDEFHVEKDVNFNIEMW